MNSAGVLARVRIALIPLVKSVKPAIESTQQGGEGGQQDFLTRDLEPKWHDATLAHIENVVSRHMLPFLLNFDAPQIDIRGEVRVTFLFSFSHAWLSWESTSISFHG